MQLAEVDLPCNNPNTPNFIYLQTVSIWVMGPTGRTKLTRCVLNGGSQSSFIAKTLVENLKMEVVDCRDLVVRAFESLF